jgi:hypothetical protein
MFETRPIGRLLRHAVRHVFVQKRFAQYKYLCGSAALALSLVLSLALSGPAMAGIGSVAGVTSLPGFEPEVQVCPAGNPALTPERIRSILKQRGFYAIRDLRYLKPSPGEWIAPISVAGRYVATASRGFGIVRWRLTVDACTAQVAMARGAKTDTH